MKKLKPVFCLAIITISIIACNKTNKDQLPTPATHSYGGKWVNKFDGLAGPLDYFSIVFNLDATATGTADVHHNSPVYTYPPAPLSWNKLKGDSVQIDFAFSAYPNEYWEFRGLSNAANTRFTADYFSIPNNNPAGKHKYGTMVFLHQ